MLLGVSKKPTIAQELCCNNCVYRHSLKQSVFARIFTILNHFYSYFRLHIYSLSFLFRFFPAFVQNETFQRRLHAVPLTHKLIPTLLSFHANTSLSLYFAATCIELACLLPPALVLPACALSCCSIHSLSLMICKLYARAAE